ncbi:hypothetical protein PY257_08910 [Ramlibacter sp. H39-3-26]|uniref:hypothetical protein n=1 Tax=Curvibacter soli TaxID=3031331 RepID=UPI0023DCE16F|nr:hypothetical protein [Ramlibacter sp. H39-3-26]MDF1485295.1 hypothetical protein [Ramlibacter sp. H39-3-26]
MEQTLGKARILALCLDNPSWGEGVCGRAAAVRHCFHRARAPPEPGTGRAAGGAAGTCRGSAVEQ